MNNINTQESIKESLNINTRYQPLSILKPVNPTKLLAVGRAWIQSLSDDIDVNPETELAAHTIYDTLKANIKALSEFAGERKPLFTITLKAEAVFSPRSRLMVGRYVYTSEMQENKKAPFFEVLDFDKNVIGKATINRYTMSHLGLEHENNDTLANETGRLFNSLLEYIDPKFSNTISLVFDRDMPFEITLPMNSKLMLFTNSQRDGKRDADFRISIETDRTSADEFIRVQQANRAAIAEEAEKNKVTA